ncbi:MAG: flagellar hook-length control protein FliK, partial [Candidatus Eisenbacteria bacterium]|nr:flagellar hook-length control protein FliK [Candidatus Eisenbacteria bacterium]
ATRVAFSEGYRRSAGTPAPASSTQAAESPNESQLPKPDPHAAQPVDGRSRIVEQRAADDPRTPAATRNLGRPGVNVIDSPARRSGRHAGATTTAQAASGPASPRTFDQATPVPMAPNGSQSARAIDAANGLALTKASGADPATPPAEPNLEAASTMPGRPITIDLRGDGGIDGHLRLTVRGESVQAAIYSANPETVRRLGTDLNELQRSLADRGFSAAKVSVHQMAQAAPAAADSQPGRQDDTPHDRRANDGDGSRRGHDPAEGRGKRENRGDHEGHEWRGGHEVRDGREVREWRGARHQER